jgi:Ca-activated chloride channel family protein
MKQSILFLILSASISLAHAEARKIQLSGKDVAADEDEQTAVELKIKSVDLQIKVHGTLASTRIEFTIHNPSDDVEAQADFILPLPPNSTVTGYALDIDGDMVDGVYVEKEKARNTYDDIVSQKIDPGLLEARDDNTFFVNIFPVPEEGQRVFSVEFITDLSRQAYELPLNYRAKVPVVSLAVEIAGKAPRLSYPQDMYTPVERRESGAYVDNKWKNLELKGVLSIRTEKTGQDRLIVERSKTWDYYFLLEDRVDQPASVPGAAPDHITLFWDASISRQHANTGAELKLLERWLKRIGAEKLTVDTVVFRDQPGKSTGHKLAGDPGPLLDQLRTVPYDGASNLAAALQTPLHGNNDYCLLFTDGEINYGAVDLGVLTCRMYIISSSPKTNPYLEDLALQSGGDYFSLATEKADSIAKKIGSMPPRLLSATGGAGVSDIYIETLAPEDDRVRISGRLASPKSGITLNYGTGDTITHSRSFELTQNATKSENTRLLWARNKIGTLLRAPHPDRESIIAVSQQHGILSPYTSLLVLEGVDQYVEYRIEPPATKKEWVKQYLSWSKELEEERAEHFDAVLEQWTALVEWWQTDFSAQPKKPQKQRAPEVSAIAAEDVGEMPDLDVAESLQRVPGVAMEPGENQDEEIVVQGMRASLEPEGPAEPSIAVKPWSPDRVYLKELDKTSAEHYFEKYLALRQEYGQLPAYYIEVADFLRNKNQPALALQVLSNLTELGTSDYTTRRILGYKLLEYGELDLAIRIFEFVLEENATEPQSFRDLGLALIQRADRRLEKSPDKAMATAARQDYLRGIDLLYNVVLEPWDSIFEGIEQVALMEINRAIAKCKALGISDFKLDKRFIKLLDVDMRVVAAWHADQADIDLWVIEPAGETANYRNQLTTIGGRVSNDMTAGFGPEEYLLKKAPKGKYTVKVHYYGADGVMPTGAVKLIVDVYTGYGRQHEKREILTIELENKEDQYLVGEIEF